MAPAFSTQVTVEAEPLVSAVTAMYENDLLLSNRAHLLGNADCLDINMCKEPTTSFKSLFPLHALGD